MEEKGTDQCFCRTKEQGGQEVERCIIRRGEWRHLCFLVGPGTQASRLLLSQSVLVGMASQDAAEGAESQVDAGRRGMGLDAARGHRAPGPDQMGFRRGECTWGRGMQWDRGPRSRGSAGPGLWEGEVGLRKAGRRQAEPLGETGAMMGTTLTGTKDTSARARQATGHTQMRGQALPLKGLSCPCGTRCEAALSQSAPGSVPHWGPQLVRDRAGRRRWGSMWNSELPTCKKLRGYSGESAQISPYARISKAWRGGPTPWSGSPPEARPLRHSHAQYGTHVNLVKSTHGSASTGGGPAHGPHGRGWARPSRSVPGILLGW